MAVLPADIEKGGNVSHRSSEQAEKDKAYTEGFEAGRSGSSGDDAVMAMFGGLVGTLLDGPHQDIYDKGHAEGRKHR